MANETINIEEQLNTLEETKSQLKTAIVNKGQTISDSDSFRSYVKKIEDISTLATDTADATATYNDIISGKTAYVAGNRVVGNLTNTSVTGKGSTTYINKSSVIPLFGFEGNCSWTGETKFLNKSQIDTSVLDGHDYTIYYGRSSNKQGTVWDAVYILIYPEGYGSVWAKYDNSGIRICSSVEFEVYYGSVIVTSTKSLATMTWSDFKKQSNTTMQQLGNYYRSFWAYNTATFRTSSGLEGSKGFENMSGYIISMSDISEMGSSSYVSNADKILTVLDNTGLANEINLTADKIIKGNTILGIEGTGETGGGVKVFNSVDEMNASTDNNDGDIALVYGINPVEPSTTSFEANTLLLPLELPVDITIASDAIDVVDGDFTIGTKNTYPYDESSTGITTSDKDMYLVTNLYDMMNIIAYALYSRNDTSSVWKRSNYMPIVRLNGLKQGKTVTTLKVADTNAEIWKYIKFGNISTIELYVYSSQYKAWKVCTSDLETYTSNVIKGSKVLGGNGLLTGTLDLTNKYDFTKVPCCTGSGLMSSDDVGVTEDSKYEENDFATMCYDGITGFGDKRYILIAYADGMTGEVTYETYYIEDPDAKLTLGNSSLTSTDNVGGFKGGGIITPLGNKSIKALSGMTPFTGLTSVGSDTLNWTITGIDFGGYDWLATNCEIVNRAGKTLKSAGPKASTTLKGQYYINIFGEKVEGTYTAPLTTEEYNTALTTAKNIKGEVE